jgi:hypothetical protein
MQFYRVSVIDDNTWLMVARRPGLPTDDPETCPQRVSFLVEFARTVSIMPYS